MTNEQMKIMKEDAYVEGALLEELYSYVIREYNGESLSAKEESRYVEIVDTLKAGDVEIPFGIEI